MKKICYRIPYTCNIGTDKEPITVEKKVIKRVNYSEENLGRAKTESYNGEYEIYDDGQPDPTSTPTIEEKVEALEAAVTMLCMPDISEV